MDPSFAIAKLSLAQSFSNGDGTNGRVVWFFIFEILVGCCENLCLYFECSYSSEGNVTSTCISGNLSLFFWQMDWILDQNRPCKIQTRVVLVLDLSDEWWLSIPVGCSSRYVRTQLGWWVYLVLSVYPIAKYMLRPWSNEMKLWQIFYLKI